jgi:hypothetical protein
MSGYAQKIALVDAPLPVVSINTSESAWPAVTPVFARSIVKPETKVTLYNWSLLGAAGGLRFLDYKSTEKCLTDPAICREVLLPQALVQNKPGFGAFEAGTVVANYYAYRFFLRHDHRTLAGLGQYIYLGSMAWTVGQNYYGMNQYWPRPGTLRQELPLR